MILFEVTILLVSPYSLDGQSWFFNHIEPCTFIAPIGTIFFILIRQLILNILKILYSAPLKKVFVNICLLVEN